MKSSRPQLVPLRIPSDWLVEFNAFYEVDPRDAIVDVRLRELLTQDMLSLKLVDERIEVVIGLGWYPDADIDGEYRLELEHSRIDHTLALFCSRDRAQVQVLLEAWLLHVNRSRSLEQLVQLMSPWKVDLG